MATARAPRAVRGTHRIAVAIHNQVDGNAAGAIATPHLTDALALSPAFRLKLDVGNLTASNCDAVAELARHQSRMSHVLSRIVCETAARASTSVKATRRFPAILAG